MIGFHSSFIITKGAQELVFKSVCQGAKVKGNDMSIYNYKIKEEMFRFVQFSASLLQYMSSQFHHSNLTDKISNCVTHVSCIW